MRVGEKYTVFRDSKCQYRISEEKSKTVNHYLKKESPELLIFHSSSQFDALNTNRRSEKFQETQLSFDKAVNLGWYILVVNTGDTPLSFELTPSAPVLSAATYFGIFSIITFSSFFI